MSARPCVTRTYVFNSERANELLREARDVTIPAAIATGAVCGIILAIAILTIGPAHAGEVKARHSLVASINAKLHRYVRPTGRCAGAQEWLATYYGFESGRRTASGQAFHPLGLTAAHRRLPFGTRLHVTNPRTGRSIGVTVNDRGPYTHANIDLSLGAARAIGMHASSYVCVSGI